MIDYSKPTPQTAAFIAKIDDSSYIDLDQVQAFMHDLEIQRDHYQRRAVVWKGLAQDAAFVLCAHAVGHSTQAAIGKEERSEFEPPPCTCGQGYDPECRAHIPPEELDSEPQTPNESTVCMLRRVEAFLCGFEDDPDQPGVNDIVADVRKAIDKIIAGVATAECRRAL